MTLSQIIKKPVFIISVIILVIIAIIYIVTQNNKSAIAPTQQGAVDGNTNNQNTQINTQSLSSKANKVIDNMIAFPYFSNDGKTLYYQLVGEQAVLYKYDIVTKKDTKISPAFNIFDDLVWSPDGIRVIIASSDRTGVIVNASDPILNENIGEETNYWIFDFTTQKIKRIGRNIQGPVWRPDGKSIAYYYFPDEGSPSVSLADQNFENWSNIVFPQDFGLVKFGFLGLDDFCYYYNTSNYPEENTFGSVLGFRDLKTGINKETQIANDVPFDIRIYSNAGRIVFFTKDQEGNLSTKISDCKSAGGISIKMDKKYDIDLIFYSKKDEVFYLPYLENDTYALYKMSEKNSSISKSDITIPFKNVEQVFENDGNIYFLSDNFLYSLRK